MPGGRPTSYTDDMLEKAYEYLSFFIEPDQRPENFNQVVPTVVGLCQHIKRAKSTVYSWVGHEDKAQFMDILNEIEEIQHVGLVNGGLAGILNPVVTKMMLTKHGYTDKLEQDIGGKNGNPIETAQKITVEFIGPDEES